MSQEIEKTIDEVKAIMADMPEDKRREYAATIKGIALGASIKGENKAE